MARNIEIIDYPLLFPTVKDYQNRLTVAEVIATR